LKQGTIQETRPCNPLTETLSRIGDKWAIQVVMELEAPPKRFSELWRSVGGISQKMLTLTLRALERDSLVTRTVYPTKPASVEYALTDLGKEMVVPIRALGGWVIENLPKIASARQRFDTEAGSAVSDGCR